MSLIHRTLWLVAGAVVCTAAAMAADPSPPAPAAAEPPGPPSLALGDSAEPRTPKRAREMLEQGKYAFIDHEGRDPGAAQHAQPAQPAGMPPEVVAQLKPMYEKSIAGLKEQIARLDPQKDAQ